MNKRFLIVLLLFECIQYGMAQLDSTGDGTIDEIYESIFSDTEDESNQQQIMDDIEYLKAHPVNIAAATYSDLISVPLISPFMAENILTFLDTTSMSDINELKNVDGMTEEYFQNIVPFFRLDKKGQTAGVNDPVSVQFRSRSGMRFEQTKGFKDHKYLGSGDKEYSRLIVRNSNIEGGLVIDKDAGEEFKDGYSNGFVSFTTPDNNGTVIAGRYSLASGQGLLLENNISISKGSNTINQIKKNGLKISPSASTNEYQYFDGITGKYSFSRIHIMSFYSHRSVAATKGSDGVITSFYSSGLFRDSSEQAKRRNVRELSYGGVVSGDITSALYTGIGLVTVQYDQNISPEIFPLEGNRKTYAYSVSSGYRGKQVNIFSEFATNNGTVFSSVNGFIYVHHNLSAAYLHRNYSRHYVNPLAHPFGERDVISDGESGDYIGIKLKPQHRVTISAYVDRYLLPEEDGKNRIGTDYFLETHARLTNKFEMTARLRTKWKSEEGLNGTDDIRDQNNYRILYRFKINSSFTVTNRFEYTSVTYMPSHYREDGAMILFDMHYRKRRSPLSVRSRFIIFDSDSYDSRLYEYESNVPGSFSDPPLYGRGSRWYLLIRYRLSNYLAGSLRYSETKRADVDVIGSGDSQISGNLDSQIAAQLDLEL